MGSRVVMSFSAPPYKIYETEDMSVGADAPKSQRFAWWVELPSGLAPEMEVRALSSESSIASAGRETQRLTFLKSGDGWRWFEEGAIVFPAGGNPGKFTFRGKTVVIS